MRTKNLKIVIACVLLASCGMPNGDAQDMLDVGGQVVVDTIEEGSGRSPTVNDVVLVNYVGSLPDGKVFDEAKRAAFPLEGIIPGFAEALTKMKKGGIYRAKIPASLGYGAEQTGPVPPNTDLTFEVELLDVQSRLQYQKQTEAGVDPSTKSPAKRNTERASNSSGSLASTSSRETPKREKRVVWKMVSSYGDLDGFEYRTEKDCLFDLGRGLSPGGTCISVVE